MAPVNMFMIGLSRSPFKTPYFMLHDFPELRTITDNWQVIRDKTLAIQAHIKAASQNNGQALILF